MTTFRHKILGESGGASSASRWRLQKWGMKFFVYDLEEIYCGTLSSVCGASINKFRFTFVGNAAWANIQMENILFEMFISTIEFVHNGHDDNSLPFLGAQQDVRRRLRARRGCQVHRLAKNGYNTVKCAITIPGEGLSGERLKVHIYEMQILK